MSHVCSQGACAEAPFKSPEKEVYGGRGKRKEETVEHEEKQQASRRGEQEGNDEREDEEEEEKRLVQEIYIFFTSAHLVSYPEHVSLLAVAPNIAAHSKPLGSHHPHDMSKYTSKSFQHSLPTATAV